MSVVLEETGKLISAAKQLLETDRALGGDFIPAGNSDMGTVDDSPTDEITPQQKAELLQQMDLQEVSNCRRCKLSETRKNTVFGEGNFDADLVFVGEAPGAEEDATGKPFVGRAGELLTKMIAAMGLSRQDIFICNMLKCRPPGNRNPSPQEIQCCWDFLVRQLQIIRPKVIVTLGNPATRGLLDTTKGITRMRGHWQKLPDIGNGLGNIDVMPTFHPAYLLRQYSTDNRAKVWSDLQAVMAKLDLQRPEKGS